MKTFLHIGGVVAIGFSGRHMLVISHSGSGIYEIGCWAKIARDYKLNYPENGRAMGIGPLAGQKINVQEMDFAQDVLDVLSPDKRFRLHYAKGTIEIEEAAQQGDAPEPATHADPA